LSFQELEKIRSDLGNVGRSAESGKVTSVGAQSNRMAGVVQDRLDTFFNTLDASQVSSGDPRRAVELVRQARQQWTNARKGEILDSVISKVDTSKGNRPHIAVLQSRLQPIVNDRRLMGKFTPQEQTVIRSLQKGTITENTLATIGKLAPEVNMQKFIGYAGAGAGALATQPAALGALGAVAAGSLAAKTAANRMAMRRASNLTENVLAGRPPPSALVNTMSAIGRGAAYIPPVISGANAIQPVVIDAYGNGYDAKGNLLTR